MQDSTPAAGVYIVFNGLNYCTQKFVVTADSVEVWSQPSAPFTPSLLGRVPLSYAALTEGEARKVWAALVSAYPAARQAAV